MLELRLVEKMKMVYRQRHDLISDPVLFSTFHEEVAQ
jgi:hypothetical protein